MVKVKQKMNTVKKSSTAVPLLLLGGGLMFTSCSSSDYDGVRKPNRGETRYDYANRADCQKDWGENVCPEQGATGGSGSGGYHFYRQEQEPKTKAQTHAIKVTWGGFGGSTKGGGS